MRVVPDHTSPTANTTMVRQPLAQGVWRSGIQAHSVPYTGIRPTVDLMHRLADAQAHSPQVRGTAESITRSLYGKDYLSELAALYYWTCDPRNTRYMRDPARVELVKDPTVAISTGQIDCDEYKTLLHSMASARQATYLAGLSSTAGNVETDTALAGYGNEPVLSHTFARAKDPRGSNRWVIMDPVAGPLTGRMLKSIRHFQSCGVL